MILNSARTWRGRARQRGGLGLVSTSVGQTPTLVFSSSPITRGTIRSRVQVAPTPIGPTYPVSAPSGGNPPTAGSGSVYGNPGGSGGWSWSGGGGIAGFQRRNQGNQNWQQGGGQSGSNWNAQSNPYGSTPQNPNNSQALAAAQALLQTNPSLLTSYQFQLLQQAGLVSNTLPYSSVSNINPTTPLTGSAAASANDPNCVAAGCTGGPYPNCTCAAAAAPASDIGTTLSQSIGGLPLYLWLVIAGGGFLLLSKRGR